MTKRRRDRVRSREERHRDCNHKGCVAKEGKLIGSIDREKGRVGSRWRWRWRTNGIQKKVLEI